MTDREVEAWAQRELSMLPPEQLLSDALERLADDRDESARVARLLINCLLGANPAVAPWRILRDALRRGAVADAVHEVDALRLVNEVQGTLRAWVDRYDPDRAALAAQHNAEVGA